MAKIDLKTLDSFQATPGEFRVLTVPPQQYLMFDGHGDPNPSATYRDALGALFPMSWGVKFASKNALGRDYVVPPLEGLWWAQDMTAFTRERDPSAWDWTMLMMLPEWVDAELVEMTRDAARRKPEVSVTALDAIRLEPLDEGLCVQTLHVGPFDAEGPVLEEMHQNFIPEHGLAMTGTHHEIYLSDIRRADPSRWRTILRQPVRRTTPSA